ncbi:MAG: ribonuclease R, partial [Bradyrhizobium sp.]|nr:ribonuclease R [Bradyrhizobium sp.]
MKKKPDNGLPDRGAIVTFIRNNPGKVGTREIAREFGLKNADRAELKRVLRELIDQDAIKKHGKKLRETAVLPPTMMVDITGRDRDGELIATPTDWDEVESGEPPKIRIHVSHRARRSATGGVGERALLRVEPSEE